MNVKKYLVSMRRIVLTAAAVSGALILALYFCIPPSKIKIEIPYGTPAAETIGKLRKEGLIISRSAMLLLLKTTGTVDKIKAGVYVFGARQTSFSIWKQLVEGKTVKVKVTVPEGFTVMQIAKILEVKGICKSKDFESYAYGNKLEGFLFPETYFFDYEMPVKKVAESMVKEFRKNYSGEFEERLKLYNFTLADHVALASMIEKEAADRDEKPLVSAVFHNRLKKRMYLESCATIQYAIGGWKKRLSYKDLTVKSPYNTYINFGLPPGPICSPGYDSLHAAVNPACSNVLYFVADGLGKHHFHARYSEHLKDREKLRAFRREWNKKQKMER